MMESEHVVVLAAVILGWLLTTASGVWSDRKARRRSTASLLYQIIVLESELRRLTFVMKRIEALVPHDLQSYEAMRQATLRKHVLSQGVTLDTIDVAMSDYRAVNPVGAFKMGLWLAMLRNLKNSRLSETAKVPSAYQPQLKLLDLGFELTQKSVRSTANKLAWSLSPWTRIGLWQIRRRTENNLSSKGASTIDDLMQSTFAEVFGTAKMADGEDVPPEVEPATAGVNVPKPQ